MKIKDLIGVKFLIFQKKKIDADSILDLSLINYKVMRNDVLDEKFIKKQNYHLC